MFSPPSAKPPVFPHADKLAHAILFGALAYLLWRSFFISGKNRPLIAGLLASAYGALTELFQLFLPNRHSDFWDFFADVSGVAIAIVIILLRKIEH